MYRRILYPLSETSITFAFASGLFDENLSQISDALIITGIKD